MTEWEDLMAIVDLGVGLHHFNIHARCSSLSIQDGTAHQVVKAHLGSSFVREVVHACFKAGF
jgi:hypothetical protein